MTNLRGEGIPSPTHKVNKKVKELLDLAETGE